MKCGECEKNIYSLDVNNGGIPMKNGGDLSPLDCVVEMARLQSQLENTMAEVKRLREWISETQGCEEVSATDPHYMCGECMPCQARKALNG